MHKKSSLDSWDDLRFFLGIAQSGSISAASRALGVEQSTISRRLGRLEKTLGVQLFDRTPEGTRLTAAGEELLSDAEAVGGHVREIEDRAAGLEVRVEGLVRVAMTEPMASLLVLPLLPDFLAQHPLIRLEIRTGVEFDDLLRRDADIAVRNVRPTHPDLVARKVTDVELGFYATREYLESKDSHEPHDLDWVAPASNETPFCHVIETEFGVAPRVLVQGLGPQIDAVQAGVGAAILTQFSAAKLGLVNLGYASDLLPPLELFLVTHRALRRVPRVRVVMDWLVEIIDAMRDELIDV